MRKLYYCTKCGNTKIGEKQCLICQGYSILPVPEKYISYLADVIPVLNKDLEEEFIEKVVKTSPNFDQSCWNRREEYQEDRKRQDEMVKEFSVEQSKVAKCPSCGSSNVCRIGAVSRVVSTSFLGLASSKIGKTHKCNNCGTTW